MKVLCTMLCALAVAVSAFAGGITYTLVDAETWPDSKRQQIEKAMDEAVELYNNYGKNKFRKELTVVYNPNVPTADGNFNGNIRFGGSISTRVALHEIAHTLGIGQHRRYHELMEDGKWQGRRAIAQLKEFDGDDAVLKGDRMHFWPYGLNFDREDGKKQRKRHVLMVYAMVRDMRLDTAR